MTRVIALFSLACPLWLATGARAADSVTKRLLIQFDGSLTGTAYTLGAGELDTTGTFVANGTPTLGAGTVSLDGAALASPTVDGFKFNPTSIGSLTTQNWVAEAVVAFDSFGTGLRTIIDVQGDADFRINNAGTSLQAVYWDGTTEGSVLTPFPATGTSVHYALVWNAAATSLTAYVNGVSIGTMNNNAFATPDTANVSFGYFGRTGHIGRGIDAQMDAVSFSTFAGAFAPATDFSLFTPVVHNYVYWDTNGATAGAGSTAPSGNWSDSTWSAAANGDAATTAWVGGAEAVLSAGSDATSSYGITLTGTQSAASVTVEEGDVTLSGGTLALAQNGLLQVNAGGFLEVASGLTAGNLTTSGDVLLNGPATVTGVLTITSSTLRMGVPLTVAGLAGAGNVDLGEFALVAGGTGNSNYSGGLLGGTSGSFTKQGTGTLTLAGSGNSSYAGPATIAAGTLETGTVAGNGSASYLGTVSGDRTVTVSTGATLRYRQANVFGGSGKSAAAIPSILLDGGTLQNMSFNILGNVTLRGAASLTNSSTDTDPDYGGYQFLGGVTVDGTSSTAALIQTNGSTRQNRLLGGAATTFTVEDITSSAMTDLIISSVLADGSGDYPGTAALVKAGAGTLSLTGLNTYTGDTTVNAGILALAGNSIADTGKLVIDGGKVAVSGTEIVETLYFGAVQQAKGTWGATNSGATHIDDVHFSGSGGVVNVTSGPGTSFAEWIADYPSVGALAGFEDDADHDGLDNGIEHVLGSDPGVFSTGLVPVSASATNLTFRHSRTNDLGADVTAGYQWSSDLVNWFPSGAANGSGTTVNVVATTMVDTAAPATDTIEVVATVTGTPVGRAFCRLSATR